MVHLNLIIIIVSKNRLNRNLYTIECQSRSTRSQLFPFDYEMHHSPLGRGVSFPVSQAEAAPFPLVITDANSVLERACTATNWSFNSTTPASYYFPFLRQRPYLFTQIASKSANLFT